ncbi:HAD family phosphatase [Oryzomonas sagensis]|uniref:HAD family phosphatase n=1 Tax=Oryzomonas sagensis TaxID=2603857 RepID=A0ABQ6TPT0_9BACT|nr:HAD family phosphatase [Oryzomonas sagensis]KAB0671053.1 HAD family phosphatase [Oryzomonas sagensis]
MVVFPVGLEANAVIFDFDGVIVDTEPLHYKAFQRILEPLGLGFSWQQYVDIYMGFDDRDAFIEAFATQNRPLDTATLSSLVERKAEIFQTVIQDGITSYPGVVELIKKLHLMKVPLAISSGALQSDIAPIVEQLGIANCFDVIVTADDVTKSKPDPETYRLAFEKLASHAALTPGRTVAIEDTPAGITAAKGAGLQVIGLTNSYPKALISEASVVLDSLEELIPFTVHP